MKEERKQQRKRIKNLMREYFGSSLKEVEVIFTRRKKGVLITYEDGKPEYELQSEVEKIIGDDWKVILKREFSERSIKQTLYAIYLENEIAVLSLDRNSNKFVCEPIGCFVNRIMLR